MEEGKEFSDEVTLETVEYEFTLRVQLSEVRMKFPCTFNLTWKVGNQTLESEGRLEPIDFQLHFNWEVKVRAAVLTSSGPNGRQAQNKKQVSTLCLNYFSKNEPNKTKMAGFLNIDLSQCIDGIQQKKHPLERCPDKNSYIEFSLDSEFIRVLTPEEANQPYSFLKMIKEDKKDKPNSFDSPMQKPRPKDTATDITSHAEHKASTGGRGSSTRKKEELNELVDKGIKDLEKTGRNTDSRTRLEENAEQLPDLLSKFKSQKELRDALQSELDDTRKNLELSEQYNYELLEEMKDLKSRLQNFQNAPKRVSVDGRLQAEVDKLQKLLDEEVEISNRLQSDLDSLMILFEEEKKKSADHKRVVDELKIQLEKSKGKNTLQEDFDKLKKQHHQLETKLHNTEQQLQTSEKNLKQEREQHQKFKQLHDRQEIERSHSKQKPGTSPPKKQSNGSQHVLEQRIAELEAQLAHASKPPTPQVEEEQPDNSNAEVVNNLIAQTESKFNSMVALVERECMVLIDVIREKERLEGELREKISQMDLQFSAACASSPGHLSSRLNEDEDVETMKRSLTRMQPSTTLNPKAEDDGASPNSKNSEYLDQLEQLKGEYTNRMKQMSDEIVRLNDIVYSSTTREVDDGNTRERLLYLQKVNHELEATLRQFLDREAEFERDQMSKKFLEDELKTISEDLSASENHCHNLMQEIDKIKTSSFNSVGSPSEIEQQLRLQNVEYQRQNTDLAIELDGFRRLQKKMEEMLSQKDSQLDDFRRSRSNLHTISSGDVENYSQSLVDALTGATASANRHREVEDIIRKLSNSTSIEDGHIQQNRLDRLWLVERLREISVDFQRLKIDRLKGFEGSSEIRKEFIKSVLPLQCRLDQLLHFNQGLLNSKLPEVPKGRAQRLRIIAVRSE